MKFYKENMWAITPCLLMILYWTIVTPSFSDPVYYVLVAATIIFALIYITRDRKDDVDYNDAKEVKDER